MKPMINARAEGIATKAMIIQLKSC